MKLNHIHIDEIKKKGEYNVISFEVFNHNTLEVIPFERKYNQSIFDIIEKHGNNDILEMLMDNFEKEKEAIIKTPIPFRKDIFLWELSKENIDFNHAIDCGYGVLEQNGKYYLFNCSNTIDFEGLMFEIYLSIVVKEYYNASINKMLSNDVGTEKLLKRLQHTNNYDLYSKLVESIKSKHGGNNLIYVDFGGK